MVNTSAVFYGLIAIIAENIVNVVVVTMVTVVVVAAVNLVVNVVADEMSLTLILKLSTSS